MTTSGCSLARELDRLLAVLGHEHVEVMAREQDAQRFAQVRLVVGDEDASFGHRRQVFPPLAWIRGLVHRRERQVLCQSKLLRGRSVQPGCL